eukprot:scaffold49680_cov30-Prasinocladus_malaysianus.AAC.1
MKTHLLGFGLHGTCWLRATVAVQRIEQGRDNPGGRQQSAAGGLVLADGHVPQKAAGGQPYSHASRRLREQRSKQRGEQGSLEGRQRGCRAVHCRPVADGRDGSHRSLPGKALPVREQQQRVHRGLPGFGGRTFRPYPAGLHPRVPCSRLRRVACVGCGGGWGDLQDLQDEAHQPGDGCHDHRASLTHRRCQLREVACPR